MGTDHRINHDPCNNKSIAVSTWELKGKKERRQETDRERGKKKSRKEGKRKERRNEDDVSGRGLRKEERDACNHSALHLSKALSNIKNKNYFHYCTCFLYVALIKCSDQNYLPF